MNSGTFFGLQLQVSQAWIEGSCLDEGWVDDEFLVAGFEGWMGRCILSGWKKVDDGCSMSARYRWLDAWVVDGWAYR